nr:siroheme synthase CysG [Oceanococcus sp. HetDA_MAG_MS8]
MEFFPLFLRLHGRPVLLVGGGEVAVRKARLLLKAGAQIHVVSPQLAPELEAALEQGQIMHRRGVYAPADLHAQRWRLIIAATDSDSLNAKIAREADALGIWVNVVDDPERCTAITPAMIDRSPLVVALSSGGAGPVLIRQLRERWEKELSPGLGGVLRWAEAWRPRVRAALEDGKQRLRLWEQVFSSAVVQAVEGGQTQAADEEMQRLLEQLQRPAQGRVWLVGAGPGDPDLLTLKALRCMQQADVVVHDRLLGEGILDLVRRDADRIDAGKRRSRHTLPQETINALLVRLAKEGKRVVRLKGGDPFVFGRGGEEMTELMAAGVPFEVVPGITAASGASAYCGIPLTHRDHAQSCIFVTGHPRQNGQLDLPWSTLARAGQTVVVYMTLTRLDDICSAIIEAGAPADRPVALIEKASQAGQYTRVATLGNLPSMVAAQSIEGPAILVIGDVVGLRRDLAWRAEDPAADDRREASTAMKL